MDFVLHLAQLTTNGLVSVVEWLLAHIESFAVIAVALLGYFTYRRERSENRSRRLAADGFNSATAFALNRQLMSWLNESQNNTYLTVKDFVDSKEGMHFNIAERRITQLAEKAPLGSTSNARRVSL